MAKKVVLYTDINNSFMLDRYDLVIENIEAINGQIQNVLNTVIGSRIKEPTFGSMLPFLLFDPTDEETAWMIETAVWDALITWLGDRIDLDLAQSRVIMDKINQSYDATVVYRLKGGAITGALNLKMSRQRQD